MNAGSTKLSVLSAALACACTSNPYVIGAISADLDGGSSGDGALQADGLAQGVTFAADFDHSGVSLLAETIPVKMGALAASLRLRGERATADGWIADSGATLARASGSTRVLREAPFTDDTRAVGVAPDAPSFTASSGDVGAIDADDFVLELVLRTEPSASIIDKSGGGNGWSVSSTTAGALSLSLTDGAAHTIVSDPLVSDAWYHCIFWVSRAIGGQAFCDARPGTLADLHALGSLASAANLAIGGGAGATGRTELAEVAIFRAPAKELDGADWASLSRERFAELTGIHPRVARGTALAKPGLRDAPAYLDLLRDGSPSRHLFLVGPDWPRIACRTDVKGARECGYLSEPKRTRWADPHPGAWKADGLTARPDPSPFADGDSGMTALVPSAASVPHGLTWTGTYGAARESLSFFVRSVAGRQVGASVTGVGAAVFDAQAGTVVSAPAGAQASVEPWGDGLFRCALAFDAGPGALTYRVELMNDPSGAPFAGDGTSPWVMVTGLQIDVGQSYTGSLLASAEQAADQLTFVADDGNLPAQGAAAIGLRLLLPAGPRVTDQAILNLNLAGTFENQVQIFLRGNEISSDTGKVQFWALRDGATYWTFFHPTPAADGARHTVGALWNATTAEIRIDGQAIQSPLAVANTAPFTLDRIDVGFSAKSSGALEGLLAGLSVGEP